MTFLEAILHWLQAMKFNWWSLPWICVISWTTIIVSNIVNFQIIDKWYNCPKEAVAIICTAILISQADVLDLFIGSCAMFYKIQHINHFCDIKHQAAMYGVSWFNNIVQVFVCCFTLLGAWTRFVISALLIVSAPIRQRLWRIYYNCHHLHLQHLVILPLF